MLLAKNYANMKDNLHKQDLIIFLNITSYNKTRKIE